MRRTKQESEKTREDLLNAAVKIFSEKGVARSTLDEIAKAANVSRGAIYWHFKNKTEMFDALYERLNHPLIERIMADLEKDHPEPQMQLRDLCVKLLLNLEEDEQIRQALILFMLKCDYSGELAAYKEKHNKTKKEKQKAFARYFEKAREKGRLSCDVAPETLAQMIGIFMKGMVIEYLDNPESFKMKDTAPKLIDLFFKNLGLTPNR